jgi:hypothetical protein
MQPLVDCQVRLFDPVAVEFAENLRDVHYFTLHRALQFCNLCAPHAEALTKNTL